MTGRVAPLPLLGSLPVEDACVTCGDVAVVLTVVEVRGSDARCRAGDGGEELVATDLVGEVAVGDRVLVHARVALEKVTGEGVGSG